MSSMSPHPVPQLININNTLPAGTIQQIRADIQLWQSNVQMLTLVDFNKINNYSNALLATQRQFITDNSAIADEEKIRNGLVPAADVNLYNGLLSMYRDYIMQLEQLKMAYNYQQQITQEQLQFQLPASYLINNPNDSNNTNSNNDMNNNITDNNNINIQTTPSSKPSVTPQQIDPASIAQLAIVNTEKPLIPELPKPDPSERIINHILKNLPTELAKDRKIFIDKLIKDSELRDSLKYDVKENPENDNLLTGIIKLCTQDVNNKENIVSYLKLLKLMGYPKELLKEKLPSSLTKPKAKPKPTPPPVSVSKSIKNLSSSKNNSSSSTNNTTNSNTSNNNISKPKLTKKKVTKPDVYIANSTNKKDNSNTSSSSSSSSSSTPPSLDKDTDDKTLTTDNDPNLAIGEKDHKKKISFSKYLKKEDSDLKSMTASSTSLKRSNEEIQTDDDNDNSRKENKKLKTPSLHSSSDQDDTTISATPILHSILKSSKNLKKPKKLKDIKIKFVNDDDLVRVYGDDLPDDGLKVKPASLKKILRPFVEGEPNEKLYLETVNTSLTSSGKSMCVIPLNLDSIKKEDQDSDIVETKGGPIKCITAVPLLYRTEFNNFNKDMKKKLPREPVITTDDIETMNNPEGRKPIIAKPFGKSKLLLRSDRGGIPYKPVPTVVRQYYPIRHQSE